MVVGNVMSSTQKAFVEGRQILGVASISNETIDSILKHNESEVLDTLDLEKVYDHLSWRFLISTV